MSQEKRIQIAKVIKPHGIKGELKLLPFTDNLDRLLNLKEVFLAENVYQISHFKSLNKFVIVKLINVDTFDLANSLRGRWIEVPREIDDINLIDDFVNAELVQKTASGIVVLGKIIDFFNSGNIQLFSVLLNNGKKEFVPANHDFLSLITKKDSKEIPQSHQVELLQDLGWSFNTSTND